MGYYILYPLIDIGQNKSNSEVIVFEIYFGKRYIIFKIIVLSYKKMGIL